MYLKRIVITSRNKIWYFLLPVITGSTGIHFRSLQIAISCKNFSFFFIFVGKLFPYYRAWRIYWCQNFYCFAEKIAKTKWIPDLIVNSRNTEWIYTETKLIVSSKWTSRYLPITRYREISSYHDILKHWSVVTGSANPLNIEFYKIRKNTK